MKAGDNPEVRRLTAGPYIVRMKQQVQSWGAGMRAGFDAASVAWLNKRGLVIIEGDVPGVTNLPVATEAAPAAAEPEQDVLSALKKVSPRASKGKKSRTSSR